MGRKSAKVYKLIDAVSTAADITSSAVTIEFLDKVGLVIEWTSTTTGSVFIDVRNKIDANNVSAWAPLSFSDVASGSLVASIAIPGLGSPHLVYLQDLSFSEFRVRYVRTSGSGTMSVMLDNKVVGA